MRRPIMQTAGSRSGPQALPPRISEISDSILCMIFLSVLPDFCQHTDKLFVILMCPDRYAVAAREESPVAAAVPDQDSPGTALFVKVLRSVKEYVIGRGCQALQSKFSHCIEQIFLLLPEQSPCFCFKLRLLYNSCTRLLCRQRDIPWLHLCADRLQ